MFPSPNGADLSGVALVGDDVFAVGEGGVILRFHDKTWSRIPHPPRRLPGLRRIAAQGLEAWITGDHGTLLHWNGDTLTAVATGVEADLEGIALRANHVWATGDKGTLVSVENGTAVRIDLPTSENLSSIWADPGAPTSGSRA